MSDQHDATTTQKKLQPLTYLEVGLDETPELLRQGVGRVVNLDSPTLGHNLFGREGTLGVPPSRVVPPGLDLVDLVPVLLVLVLDEAHVGGLNVNAMFR